MSTGADDKPMLRPVEIFPAPDNGRLRYAVRDRSGLSDIMLTMAAPAVRIMALLDGTRTCGEVCDQFGAEIGQSLSRETLRTILDHLERAHLLEGESFESFYRSRLDDYRRLGVRAMPHAEALGVTADSRSMFDEMLADTEPTELVGPVRGLVSPHLDYPRGRPCYAAAYGALRGAAPPDRVVILGTNHAGRSHSVVATANDFETPLGTTRTDTELLARLERRCGDLRADELDHANEHSVELQVLWLQHLFGADAFQMLAVLCPDPCAGTSSSAEQNGRGDLDALASALREVIGGSDRSTMLVAGADLSHVGAAFGDDRELDQPYLAEVRELDLGVLAELVRDGPGAFVRVLRQRDNATNVCSAGCIYALATALPGATITRLRYHQAVDLPTQTCVTCAALVLT